MAAKNRAIGGIKAEIYAVAQAQARSHGQHLNEYVENTLLARWGRDGVDVPVMVEPPCNEQPEPEPDAA